MEVIVLGSGSRGNCTCIRSGSTTLLVDAGFNRKTIFTRLAAVGISPDSINAVLFTHDHSDHCSAIGVAHRFLKAELLANAGTSETIDSQFPEENLPWTLFETSQTLDLGDFTVETFPVPHDAAEPVGFVFDDGRSRLFYATDLGCVTSPVSARFATCDAAVLESNHDLDMLWNSERSYALKTRIAGRVGHLSNTAAAELVREHAGDRLKTLLLAHLSDECNTPELARATMKEAVRAEVRVETLRQNLCCGPLVL